MRLASASPRRAELLDALGIRYLVESVGVDETPLPGEDPEQLVARLAAAKARAVTRAIPRQLATMAADTVVVADGEVLGKPTDTDHAAAMLRRLSGREHRVLTAVAVTAGETLWSETSTSYVRFASISAEDCVRYAQTGEGLDKAGGYAIQGIGGIFVTHLSGSFSGVMGLPVDVAERLLRAAGVDCWQHRFEPGRD